MTRALIVKELRESALLIALAALAAGFLLAALWRWPIAASFHLTGGDLDVPFLRDGAPVFVAVVGCGLAALLGLKQSAWEELTKNYYYLFHRPVSRERVLIVKLLVGLTAVMGMTAGMIVLHGLWAARPGHLATPFYWSMTSETWRGWTVLPIVYLGAFLSGIRPARWYGSRLFPLVGAFVPAFILGMLPWFWITLPGSVLLSLMLVVCILHTARVRDY